MENNNKPKAQEFWGMPEDTYTIIQHVSQYSGVVIPLSGIIMPLVMWLTNKQNSKKVDEHGKAVINWLISSTIYIIVLTSLIIYFSYFLKNEKAIIPMLILLVFMGLLKIIYPIIGAVQASNNKIWTYPLAIPFIK